MGNSDVKTVMSVPRTRTATGRERTVNGRSVRFEPPRHGGGEGDLSGLGEGDEGSAALLDTVSAGSVVATDHSAPSVDRSGSPTSTVERIDVASAPPASVARGGYYRRSGKRVVDVLVASALCVILAPVIGIVAATVRVGVGAGVIYVQDRVGLNGRTFRMYKFRTMRPDRRVRSTHEYVGADRRRQHKTVADPRHTKVGRTLRRLSLDELPQLVNVLRGDMSLVGPRPELPFIVDRYEPWQHARHLVRPGITGLWQISARNDAAGQDMHEFVHLDVAYVHSVSLRTDVEILTATAQGLLTRRLRGA